MANKKISQFDKRSTLYDSDLFLIAENNKKNYKVEFATLKEQIVDIALNHNTISSIFSNVNILSVTANELSLFKEECEISVSNLCSETSKIDSIVSDVNSNVQSLNVKVSNLPTALSDFNVISSDVNQLKIISNEISVQVNDISVTLGNHVKLSATNEDFGHIKIGYTPNLAFPAERRNYPLCVDKNGKAFVHIDLSNEYEHDLTVMQDNIKQLNERTNKIAYYNTDGDMVSGDLQNFIDGFKQGFGLDVNYVDDDKNELSDIGISIALSVDSISGHVDNLELSVDSISSYVDKLKPINENCISIYIDSINANDKYTTLCTLTSQSKCPLAIKYVDISETENLEVLQYQLYSVHKNDNISSTIKIDLSNTIDEVLDNITISCVLAYN